MVGCREGWAPPTSILVQDILIPLQLFFYQLTPSKIVKCEIIRKKRNVIKVQEQ